jgi:hypothetical protein
MKQPLDIYIASLKKLKILNSPRAPFLRKIFRNQSIKQKVRMLKESLGLRKEKRKEGKREEYSNLLEISSQAKKRRQLK